MSEIEAELDAATAAVRTAAALCEQVRHDLVPEAIVKVDRSPVTVADFGAQAVVCRMIADAFPDDPIVGEEGSAALRDPAGMDSLAAVTELVAEHLYGRLSGSIESQDVLTWIDLGAGKPARRFWTLDPIDGTRGFLRGDQYAVALSLIVDGEVRVAALACPALDSVSLGDAMKRTGTSGSGALVVAARGGGAWAAPLSGEPAGHEWQRLTVCDVSYGECLRFVESVEAGHANHDLQGAVARAAGIDAAPLRMDSQAKYAAIAGGLASLYLRLPRPGIERYREKIWDHAAGALIVEEAGGRVTDMLGRSLDFGEARLVAGAGVVASNGTLHPAVIRAIRG